MQSSEIWENGAFRTGTLIPEPLFNICQLTLEDRDTGDGDKIFIVGDNLRSYLLDWRTQTWSRLPDKSVNGDGPGCGYVRSRENGLEIVVAVSGRSEIFNWDTQTWRAGPDTPSGGYDSQVPHDEKSIFGDMTKVLLFYTGHVRATRGQLPHPRRPVRLPP